MIVFAVKTHSRVKNTLQYIIQYQQREAEQVWAVQSLPLEPLINAIFCIIHKC